MTFSAIPPLEWFREFLSGNNEIIVSSIGVTETYTAESRLPATSGGTEAGPWRAIITVKYETQTKNVVLIQKYEHQLAIIKHKPWSQ